MRHVTRLMGALGLVPLMACASPQFHASRVGEPFSVRSGDQLVTEGRMQAANGNFGLAIDTFRRAIRQSPQSVEAYDGLAASYDRLGRFDLARRYYEEALAFAPADVRLQTHYAASLRAHGLTEQAAQLEAMVASAQAAAATPLAAAESPAVADVPAPAPTEVRVAAAPAASVPVTPAAPTVTMPPASAPVPLAVRPQSVASAPVVASTERPSGPRLERLNDGEVLLVTRPETQMSGANGFRRVEVAARQPTVAARQPTVTARQPLATTRQSVFAAREPVVSSVLRNAAQGGVAQARSGPQSQLAVGTQARILNAVGRRGQASRMEGHLRSLGWQQTSIGDAQARRSVSVIFTPTASVRQATALARSLPFRPRVVRSARVRQVMLVLGTDAVAFDQQLLRGGRRS